MSPEFLKSIPLEELTKLSSQEVRCHHWYLTEFGGISTLVTQARPDLKDEDWDWVKEHSLYSYYCLREALDYIFNNLEDGQPTFDHVLCPECNTWQIGPLIDYDHDQQTACQSCVDGFIENKEEQETRDLLDRTER